LQEAIQEEKKGSNQSKQTKLEAFAGANEASYSMPKLHIVQGSEDKRVRIGKHEVNLSLLADIFRLYFEGLSTRALEEHVVTRGIDVSYVTIWHWVQTLSHLLYTFTMRFAPIVGNVWYADEMLVGKYWLVLVRDRTTHFILAIGVVISRAARSLRKILEQAKAIARKCPENLKTDGWSGYPKACRLAFRGETKHEFKSKDEPGGLAHTNFCEGSQRATRARLDARAAFHGTPEEALDFAKGYAVHHNYIKKSPAADNTRPAEASLLPNLGDNPALTILWNALEGAEHIPIRRHIPHRRRAREIQLTRWTGLKLTMRSFLPSRRRKAEADPKLLDIKISRWCGRRRHRLTINSPNM